MTRRFIPALFALLSACSTPPIVEPSLAPRPGEAIDPRVPIASDIAPGTVDPALATQLDGLVRAAAAGQAEFDARAAVADRLASVAAEDASESWIAAQQALSRLVEQQGVTARALADIDALAAKRLQDRKWIVPAEQEAIRRAQNAVSAIAVPQQTIIDRLRERLAR